VLATLPNGWRVKIVYRLEGQTKQTLVRLMGVHQEDELLEKMAGALPPPPPRQQPKPEKEKPDQEGDDDGGDEHAVPKVASEKGKYPKAVSQQLVERKGYANYHFNLVQQNRFIEALRRQAPGGKVDEKVGWVIEAETDEPNPRKTMIRVTPGKLAMVVGEAAFEADTKSDLYDSVSAQSVAGILPALNTWRRMIADGPKRFGETFYLGTMPLGGSRPLRDCMVGIDGELEVRWLSHPESQLVEVVEVFADRDEDPAEMWVFREREGDDAPSILELRYGLETVLRLRIKSWQRVPESESEGAAEEEA
jgi:hypothetical protein